jgi:bile acid:Na+ symporter, BASS family
MPRLFLLLTNAFPVWVFLAAFLALINPSLFTWFQPYITPGLGVIMLGMGLTLTLEDFREVARRPILVLTGFILQYTIMPFAGWLSARTFHLPAPLAAGLILVACCPGGTASNVVAYLAKADVPLSVTMTAVSTLLAVVMTPALTTWLI